MSAPRLILTSMLPGVTVTPPGTLHADPWQDPQPPPFPPPPPLPPPGSSPQTGTLSAVVGRSGLRIPAFHGSNIQPWQGGLSLMSGQLPAMEGIKSPILFP